MAPSRRARNERQRVRLAHSPTTVNLTSNCKPRTALMRRCAAERRLMVWPILHLKGPDVWFLVKAMGYHSTNLGAVMGPCSPSLWHYP